MLSALRVNIKHLQLGVADECVRHHLIDASFQNVSCHDSRKVTIPTIQEWVPIKLRYCGVANYQVVALMVSLKSLDSISLVRLRTSRRGSALAK